MDFTGLSSSETEEQRNLYFPDDLVHVHTICDENTSSSSVDSDSDSEVSFQPDDVFHVILTNLNMHELAVDFVKIMALKLHHRHSR